jgi:hypothetical protein
MQKANDPKLAGRSPWMCWNYAVRRNYSSPALSQGVIVGVNSMISSFLK